MALLKVYFICFHLEDQPAVRCLCLNLWFHLAQSLPSSQMVRAWTFLYLTAAIVRMSEITSFLIMIQGALIVLIHRSLERSQNPLMLR